MHDIRLFLHKAGNQSTPPTLMSSHDTQPLLAVAKRNDEAVIARASELQPKTQSCSIVSSSFLPINISETSDDDDTPLEVNHEAEVLIAITSCPRACSCFSICVFSNGIACKRCGACESRDSSS